jgi:hypothetical protein
MEATLVTLLLQDIAKLIDQPFPPEQIVIREQNHPVRALPAGVADLERQEVELIQEGIGRKPNKELGASPECHRLTAEVAGQATVSIVIHHDSLV